MTINGADVSSYQPTYDTSGLDFVFIKVTQGLGYVNPDWVEQRATARRAGLVTGFYHYPTISNSPEAEVDYFLAQINLVAGDILCLDWEWYGQNVSDQQARDYKDRWIAYARQKAPGHRIVVYSDVSNWTGVDTDSNVGDGLWIATAGRPAGQPGIQHAWVFHQWTDSPLDRDVANFAILDDLKKWAGAEPAPAPQETDMPQWIAGSVTPGAQPTVVLVPHGDAWSAYQKRTLHLGVDEIGNVAAKATVRIAAHNGKTWGTPTEQTVIAAGGTVDVDVTGAVKVSLQSNATGVAYAIESW